MSTFFPGAVGQDRWQLRRRSPLSAEGRREPDQSAAAEAARDPAEELRPTGEKTHRTELWAVLTEEGVIRTGDHFGTQKGTWHQKALTYETNLPPYRLAKEAGGRSREEWKNERRRIMKKIAALILAVVLAMAMTSAAFATSGANMTGESGVIGEFTTYDSPINPLPGTSRII